MEEIKSDLNTLKECIKNLNNFLENADECESISLEEYDNINEYLNVLENRKMRLEIKIENENV